MKYGKLLVAALFCFLVFPETSSAKSFSDVNMTSEMGRAVDDLSNRGIISGYSDGTFRPSNSVTRAQAAKIVAGAVKAKSLAVKNPEIIAEYPEYFTPRSFKDLALSSAYYEPVSALGEWGAMNGYEDNTFKPNNTLTRAQIAKVLTRAYVIPEQGYESYSTVGKQFTDVNGESDSYKFIRQMYELGIMQETSKNTFSPNKKVTRGELALYIYRLDQYFKQQLQASASNPVLNGSDSLVAKLFAGQTIMEQPIYYGAPVHAVRMTIDDTFTFGEVEGGHCSTFSSFSLCGTYLWEDNEIGGLVISVDGYTILDFEEMVGQSIEVETYYDGPSPHSFYFEYNDLVYYGETYGPSKSDEIFYFEVSVPYEE